MTKVTDIRADADGGVTILCDFSPPRGPAYDDVDAAQSLSADCLFIPYNPGKSVYANSAMAAHAVRSATGKDVVFALATRDMNVLAAQSLVVGASLLGLENVVVVRGDSYSSNELRLAGPAQHYTPTELIRSMADMNRGIDFRGRSLSTSTAMCIGATIDTHRPVEHEVALTYRKIQAGASFFLTQPAFAPGSALHFVEAYERAHGAPPAAPIFFGVHMAAQGSRSFSTAPKSVLDELEAGAAPSEVGIRTINSFIDQGMRDFYLLPPVFPGGWRDYESARQVLDYHKQCIGRRGTQDT